MKRFWLILAIPVALAFIFGIPRFAPPADRASIGTERFQRQAVYFDSSVPTVVPARDSGPIAEVVDRTDVVPGLVIRNGQATIGVDSLEPALAAVRRLAERLGGYLANTAVQAGDRRLRSATLELKIPAARFDEAIGGLPTIGEVESMNVSAQDVGEEFVDVTARMENARRLERRLIGILTTRTGKLADVLEVEQALARVREAIERSEGRLRYLREHAATSSLTIAIHEPEPVVGRPGTSVMGEAFAQAWRNFVWLAAVGIESLGVVVPAGVVAVAAWLALKRRRNVVA